MSKTLQERVGVWVLACFGAAVAADRRERSHRFLEEALEMVQAAGCTRDEALQLVDYVFGRPAGELRQEVGGVMLTLAAFCLAHDLSMDAAAEEELARVWTKVEAIRAKQATKPRFSPLPGVAPGDRDGPRPGAHLRAMANAVLRQLDETAPREELDLDAVRALARAWEQDHPAWVVRGPLMIQGPR